MIPSNANATDLKAGLLQGLGLCSSDRQCWRRVRGSPLYRQRCRGCGQAAAEQAATPVGPVGYISAIGGNLYDVNGNYMTLKVPGKVFLQLPPYAQRLQCMPSQAGPHAGGCTRQKWCKDWRMQSENQS